MKKVKCQLCGKETDEKLETYVDGWLGTVHPSCVKIAKKSIDGYLKFQKSRTHKR